MADIPLQTIDAASAAMRTAGLDTSDHSLRVLAEAALEAAAPHIAEAERQRILPLVHDLRQRLYELSNDYDERDNELRFDARIDLLEGDTDA